MPQQRIYIDNLQLHLYLLSSICEVDIQIGRSSDASTRISGTGNSG
jgi:hypothetical protein